MDVMLRRVGFGLLAVLAVLLAFRKPATVYRYDTTLSQDNRAQALLLRVSSAKLYWSALEQRDSALASTDTAQVELSGFSVGASLMPAESVYVATLISGVSRDSSIQVRLHLYDRDRYGSSWWGSVYSGTLVAGDPARCTAILPASQNASKRVEAGRHRLGAALGPCLLHASFGNPGGAVSNWLQSLRYAPAMSGEWLTRMNVEPWASEPWTWLLDRSFAAPGPRALTLSRLLGLEQIAGLLAPPYYYGQIGLQCLSGIRASCVRGVLDPGIVSQATQPLPTDLTLSPTQIRSPDITVFTIRPPGASFLSDLIQEKGPERFSRFWKSQEPFQRAFQEAFQEPLGDWTYRWARKRWLSEWDARHRSADIVLGVTVRPLWLPLILGWSVIAVVVAGWAAQRRQVTVS